MSPCARMALFLSMGLLFMGCAEAEEPFDVFVFDPMVEPAADGLETDPLPDAAAEPDSTLDPGPDLPGDEAPDDPAADGMEADFALDPAADPETPDTMPDPDSVDMPVDDPAAEDPACGSSVCSPGETCCFGMYCADLANDVDNCGTCGSICWSNEADTCSSGSCICSGSSRKCTGNLDDTCCESDGCRDLWTDEDHCGMCGWWCSFGEECVSGWCDGW